MGRPRFGAHGERQSSEVSKRFTAAELETRLGNDYEVYAQSGAGLRRVHTKLKSCV